MTYLFVYGRLMHDLNPPQTIYDWQRDAVRGTMFLRDSYDPAIVHAGQNDQLWCSGELQTIDSKELAALDECEAPEYRREQVWTKSGKRAWIYVYNGAVPANARRIAFWTPEMDLGQ